MPVVVAFISQKGGVGKSTLARALAAIAAHAGLRMMLADLDPRQQTIAQWQIMRQQNKVTPRIAVEAFDDVEAAIEAAGDCELLVLDTPGGVSASTLTIAQHSHLIVQPSGPGLDDLYPAVLLFHELTSAGIPKSRLVAALCRVLSDEEAAPARHYFEEAGYEVLAGSIPESTAYRLAHNRGNSLIETDTKSFNARADALMEALLIKIARALEETRAEAPIEMPKREGGGR